MNSVTVGILTPPVKDLFISRSEIDSLLFTSLSAYIKIEEIPINKYLNSNNYDVDYIWVDLTKWSCYLFYLREKGQIKSPFIIFLHVIHLQYIEISCILPLIQKEDLIIVSSQYSKNVLSSISPSLPIMKMPFFLDLSKIYNKITTIPNNYKTLIYLGRLHEEKGIETLINCLPEIYKNIGFFKLKIIAPFSGFSVFDSTKSDFFHKLNKKIKDLEISNLIEWVGGVVGYEKYQLLHNADVLINPSLVSTETFGVVNIEALASGIPVICTKQPAFEEIIKKGYNGYHIKVVSRYSGRYTLNNKDLIKKVSHLLSNEALLTRLKINAKESSLEYDKEKIVHQLINILKPHRNAVIGNFDNIKQLRLRDFEHLYSPKWIKLLESSGLINKKIEEIIVRRTQLQVFYENKKMTNMMYKILGES